MPIYDLTKPISSDTLVFPGDPPFECRKVESLEKGGHYDLCAFSMNNHMGTHIDFPAHVILGGKTSDDFPISELMGTCLVIECAETAGAITREFISSRRLKLLTAHFIFFKQSLRSNEAMYLEPNAAVELMSGAPLLKGVGVESISIDAIDQENLPVHHELLERNILIIENLNLSNVSEGIGEVIIAPINIFHMDGLPARVILQR